ncbi:putative discoidin domain protein [Methylocaldum marinum]|uniref:Putative discoidin domain protein n=1 Tax=Methylocaldum marinum TaxID=1432792 RepID=A0A250KSC9_9GAMM|nr:putative discoidin domain protein [Methylocaldum marinum]
MAWGAYMPYEVRIVEAMIRMGRREQALTLFNFLLKNQRSAGWNHWAYGTNTGVSGRCGR